MIFIHHSEASAKGSFKPNIEFIINKLGIGDFNKY
jgi:hypothetical protein